MGKIRLTGATSGYTELKAAEAAGNNTITLPTTNGGEVIVSDSSGNVNIDSGTFYVDASNNRVGIGTSSPVYLVDAQGGRALFTANSETYSVGVRNRASLAPNGNFWIGATNAVSPDMVFSNNAGNERMRITDGGNVGIGTTSAAAKLHVEGDSFFTDWIYAGNSKGISSDSASRPLLFALNGLEKARLDTSGRLLVGTSSARSTGSGSGIDLQVEGTPSPCNIGAIRNSNNAFPARIAIAKTRGTSVGSNTIVQSGDSLGLLEFDGADGTQLLPGAYIEAVVDGTPGVNDLPTRLVFSTTADGASSPTERLRIANTGAIGLSGANYGTSGQVLTSQGSGAAPQWATLSTGSMVFINSVTASNSASVAFTSGINSTYDVYMIQYVAAYGSASSELRLRVSTNGGSSYESSSYQFGTTISSISPIQFGLHIPVNDLGNGSGGSAGQGTIYIYSPARSNEYTAVLSQSIRGTGTNMYYSQGEYQVKNVVNAIQLFASSGNVSGVFRLYGIKNS